MLWVLTFTAVGRNLGEGVVAAVTLASDDAGLTLTLAALSIARPGERADRVAVTQQARIAALGTVVVVLETRSERGSADFTAATPDHSHTHRFPPEGPDKLQLLV